MNELELTNNELERTFSLNGVDSIISQFKDKFKNVVFDVSTAKGRDECRSAAAKIAKSKVLIDNYGKQLTEDMKTKCKVIDNDRKKIRDELDALKDEVRKPLTDWEDAEKEKERIEQQRKINANLEIEKINSFTLGLAFKSSVIIDSLIQRFESETIDKNLHLENYDFVLNLKKSVIDKSKELLCQEIQKEKEQEELKRLRKEIEEKEAKEKQRIREEQIAKEASEKAERQAKEKFEREQKEKENQERNERLRIEREAQQKIDEQKKLLELEKQKEEKRLEEEKRKIIEQQKRDADIEHRKKVNNNIKNYFVNLGCEETVAIKIISAIVKNEINNISIKY